MVWLGSGGARRHRRPRKKNKPQISAIANTVPRVTPATPPEESALLLLVVDNAGANVGAGVAVVWVGGPLPVGTEEGAKGVAVFSASEGQSCPGCRTKTPGLLASFWYPAIGVSARGLTTPAIPH